MGVRGNKQTNQKIIINYTQSLTFQPLPFTFNPIDQDLPLSVLMSSILNNYRVTDVFMYTCKQRACTKILVIVCLYTTAKLSPVILLCIYM